MACDPRSVNAWIDQKGDWYVRVYEACGQGRLHVFVCNFSKPDARTCLFAAGARGNQSTPQGAKLGSSGDRWFEPII